MVNEVKTCNSYIIFVIYFYNIKSAKNEIKRHKNKIFMVFFYKLHSLNNLNGYILK